MGKTARPLLPEIHLLYLMPKSHENCTFPPSGTPANVFQIVRIILTHPPKVKLCSETRITCFYVVCLTYPSRTPARGCPYYIRNSVPPIHDGEAKAFVYIVGTSPCGCPGQLYNVLIRR